MHVPLLGSTVMTDGFFLLLMLWGFMRRIGVIAGRVASAVSSVTNSLSTSNFTTLLNCGRTLLGVHKLQCCTVKFVALHIVIR